jgi:hypothetical protein
MRRVTWCSVALIAAIAANGCGKSAPPANAAVCADPVAGCRFNVGDREVALRFSEAPRAMRQFVVEVEAPWAAAIEADFSMPGMEMLPNRNRLRREADGHWRATAILPVCVSGREDWILTMTADGKRVAVPFSAEH